jgi:acyl carrier protein
MEDQFLRNLAQALERDDDVKWEDEFRNYKEWDSLSLLVVLSMIDDEYGVSIDAGRLAKMKTVKHIHEFIESHLS